MTFFFEKSLPSTRRDSEHQIKLILDEDKFITDLIRLQAITKNTGDI
jgi:hypothetical protein